MTGLAEQVSCGVFALVEPELRGARVVLRNGGKSQLCEHVIRRGEGKLGANGQVTVVTAPYTGRSPNDKFLVREPSSEAHIDWGKVNRPIDEAQFLALRQRVVDHLATRELFVQDCFAGAAARYRTAVRVITENAWHALFAHHMFLRPEVAELKGFEPSWTVYHAPRVLADPAADGTNSSAFVLMHMGRREVVIGGTWYGGEIKKSIFTALNYELTFQDVMPMHCSANKEHDGSNVAVFFGLSGTGKTTLSTDSERVLIGDDEHGWSDEGVFNFEGGCYAKVIRLSETAEPEIWEAVHQFGAVIENVVIDEDSRALLLDDGTITENTRGAYPVTHLRNMDPSGIGDQPKHVILLTCDAFGVMPPLAKLTREQAMYHFLSGYTAKVAGTERGVKEPQATFSACFGAPFLPLCPTRYAVMLGERISRHKTRCWLVNTGWTGGSYGEGERICIAHTRRLVRAALAGELDDVATTVDPVFGLAVPVGVRGVPTQTLNPRETWADQAAFDAKAAQLATLFNDNFAQFAGRVDDCVAASAPSA